MPGPNVVNLSMMIGARAFGFKGAMTALAGMLTVPLILVLLMALVYALVYAQVADYPAVAGALRCMGAVEAGLIGATGLKLFGALQRMCWACGCAWRWACWALPPSHCCIGRCCMYCPARTCYLSPCLAGMSG